MRAVKLIGFCFLFFLIGEISAQEEYFYGSPSISFPLYTLKNGDITIPISMSFS